MLQRKLEQRQLENRKNELKIKSNFIRMSPSARCFKLTLIIPTRNPEKPSLAQHELAAELHSFHGSYDRSSGEKEHIIAIKGAINFPVLLLEGE